MLPRIPWKYSLRSICLVRSMPPRTSWGARITRVTEPGLWLQYDFGDGPVIDGRKTVLFCAWLAWSR